MSFGASRMQFLPYLSRRLFLRINLFFLVIALVSALISTLMFWFIWNQYQATAKQVSNWGVAGAVARELYPYLHPELDEDAVKKAIQRFSRFNPANHIYLLDITGKILFSSVNAPVSTVDVRPIERVIRYQGLPFGPIRGDNPAVVGGERLVISAFRERIGKVPGYVYVVIGGGESKRKATFRIDSREGKVSLLYFLGNAVLYWMLCVLFFSFTSSRFRAMSKTVEAFASGNYNSRISVRGADELGRHASAFNRMADTLEQNIAALEQTDELRRELIENVSHDLKLPIAVMQVSLENLLMKLPTLGRDEFFALHGEAEKGCRSLERLLADFSEISILAAEQFDAKRERILLDELIRDISSQLAAVASKKDITLLAELPSKLPPVYADRQMIDRAISNLAVNGIRYTPAGGTVRIDAEAREHDVIVSVTDNGPGIPEEEVRQIFERFYRSKAGRSASSEGSGLGLAIVKRITELHGSRLDVESTPGKGTTFRFYLEVAK